MRKSFWKRAPSMLCALAILFGCTNSKMMDNKKSPLEFEYDSFVSVKPSCLKQFQDTVEKTFGKNYVFKNAIKSREKPYLEAMFTRIEGGDSTVVVKYDDLCNIKRMYRSLMTFSAEE